MRPLTEVARFRWHDGSTVVVAWDGAVGRSHYWFEGPGASSTGGGAQMRPVEMIDALRREIERRG